MRVVQPHEILTAVVSATASGDNTIVAATAGSIIEVYWLYLIVGGTTTVRFESGAGGTALTGVMACVASDKIHWPVQFNEPYIKTASGALLNLETSSTAGVIGVIKYRVISA